jgi:hypothetical protein
MIYVAHYNSSRECSTIKNAVIFKLWCRELLSNQIRMKWRRRLNEELLKPLVLLQMSETEHSGCNMHAERIHT